MSSVRDSIQLYNYDIKKTLSRENGYSSIWTCVNAAEHLYCVSAVPSGGLNPGFVLSDPRDSFKAG